MANPFETEGMLSWFELMTTDTEDAKRFYQDVVGWTFEQDSNNKEYTLIKAKDLDHPIGGIVDRKIASVDDPSRIPPHWGNYITIKDLDEALRKVEKLGGKIIVPATEIPKVGTFSVIQDPQGATISLMQYQTQC